MNKKTKVMAIGDIHGDTGLVKRLAEMAEAAGVRLTPEQVQQVEALVTQRMQKHLGGSQPAQQPEPTQMAAPKMGIVQQETQGA